MVFPGLWTYSYNARIHVTWKARSSEGFGGKGVEVTDQIVGYFAESNKCGAILGGLDPCW